MEAGTDPATVKLVACAVGGKWAADAEHGPKLIEPPQSPGVFMIDDDSALVIRVKFKSRPGAPIAGVSDHSRASTVDCFDRRIRAEIEHRDGGDKAGTSDSKAELRLSGAFGSVFPLASARAEAAAHVSSRRTPPR